MENNNIEDQILLVKKKRSNKKKTIILITSLFVILCVIVAFFVIKSYYNSRNTLDFKKYDVYQYFAGVKYEYTGVASYEKDKLINVNDEGKKIEVDDSPIYFQAVDNECIVPINMGLFFLSDKSKSYRINYFSRLSTELSDNKEMGFVTYDGKKSYMKESFLYDGNDLYVFPYSIVVEVEGKKYELSPLSYVKVLYKNSVEMYNKAKDEYIEIEEINDDVIAYFGDYKINLSTDMIISSDGERLLIKNVNKLLPYEGE